MLWCYSLVFTRKQTQARQLVSSMTATDGKETDTGALKELSALQGDIDRMMGSMGMQ